MNTFELFSVIIVIGLLVWVANQDVQQVSFFDKHNNTLFDRISPRYDDNGIQKTFIERGVEFIFLAPTKLFPKQPWLGVILLGGGVFILLKKWELIWSKIRRENLFAK